MGLCGMEDRKPGSHSGAAVNVFLWEGAARCGFLHSTMRNALFCTHTQLLCVLDSGQWSLNSCYLGVQQSCVPCLAHPLPPSSVYWVTGVSQASLCPLQPPLLSSPLPMRRALPHIHIPRRMRDAKCLGSAAVFKPHPAT